MVATKVLTIRPSRRHFVARLNSGVRPLKQIHVHVSDDPDDFMRVALQAQKILGGDFGVCADGLDQSYWDLAVPNGGTVTIHREHYCGVSILADSLSEVSVASLRRFAEATGHFEPAWAAPADAGARA